MIRKEVYLVIAMILLVASLGFISGKFIIDSGESSVSVSSLQQGLVGHWTLDEIDYNSNTNRITDKSAYLNHGTNSGATFTTDRHGNANSAMDFDGTDTFTTAKIFSDSVNQEWTVTGWVYLDRNTVTQYLNNFNHGNEITHSSTTKALLYGNSGENDHYTYSSGTIPTGQWIHFAYVYRTSDRICKIYLNGALDKSATNYGVGDTPSGFAATTIFGQSFDGKMDDIRVYNRVLSLGEINLLANSHKSAGGLSSGSLNKGLLLDMPLSSGFDKTEGTTNVVTNTNLDTGWSKGYTDNIQWNDTSPPIDGSKLQVVSFTNDDTGGQGYWYCYGNYAPQADATTYTVSVWAKTDQTSNVQIKFYTADNGESDRHWSEAKYVNAAEGWKKIVWNSFTTANPTDSDSLSFWYDDLYEGGYTRLWLWGPQMEAKNGYATAFVEGTRSSKTSDKSAYSNHGIIHGATSYTDHTSFDGGDWIGEIENPNFIEPAAITVSSWINMDVDAPTARNIWLTKWYGFSSEIQATTRIPYFRLNGPGDIFSNTSLTLGTWQHFVGTYDPSIGGGVYLDGKLVGTMSPNGAITYSRDYPLNIGRYYGGIYFKGDISNVKIYDRALSLGEVELLHARGRS